MDTKKILQATAHRPFPLPEGPWIMQQEWHDLLFAHYPIAPELLRPLVPAQLPLDTYEGSCWIGIVPFSMSQVYPRGLFSVPGLSAFPELNVRTYVTVQDMPGVYFFSLDAGNPIAVQLARSLFHLPYFNASMQIQQRGERWYYRSQRRHPGAPQAEFRASYRPIADVTFAAPGTLKHWYTERYCLYTVYRQQIYRAHIQHERWPLQAAEWDLQYSSLAQAHALSLAHVQPHLDFSRLQEVLVWPLRRVDAY